ncbi:MAG: PilX N-terminal domain-containing pilus assembly protein [Myxococcota bacterium]|jgi:Tfp pilus assembly protein PilX|nr:PilX N-terminal domain-containing pilus assembly protein [Myxococcota bacterium]
MRFDDTRTPTSQDGNVLVMVMLLVLLFSGLGVLVMRHMQGEMRSSLAYYDATQAGAAAEGAVAMVATDLMLNYDAPAVAGQNYMDAFAANRETGLVELPLEFSSFFDTDDTYTAGELPDANLNGRFTDPATPVADTSVAPAMASGTAQVQVVHMPRYPAPPPPGYSNDDASTSNTVFYYFEVRADARYGPQLGRTAPSVVEGYARARTRMMIGPLPKR